jgi:uncharacterized protein (TIGR02996 family)
MAKSRKPTDRVAPLPGEAAMLSAVLSDLRDDDVKLVYADWLEEQGDRRGAFLREFVHAMQNGKKLPAGADISPEWQEMVGLSILRRVCEGGLAAHRAAIMALAMPALAIAIKPRSESQIALGRTKFGGLPHLPRGAPWPRCERGPLEFLAQLDLAELQQTFAGRALPGAGLLSFFMYHHYSNDQYGGAGGLRIIHTEDPAGLVRLDPPDDLTEEIGRPSTPCRLSFTELLDLPDADETWVDRYGTGFRQSTSRPDLSSALWQADHQLFGYAHVTVLGQDPIPGLDWQQLIRFSSDRTLKWGWGDGHHLFWYIKKNDLQRGYFEETEAIDG